MTGPKPREMRATLPRVRGILFDVDDTLYPEEEFLRTGYRVMAEYLGDPAIEDRLHGYEEAGSLAVERLMRELKADAEATARALTVYRTHPADIALYPGTEALLQELLNAQIPMGIITDGRAEGQWNKIRRLRLTRWIPESMIIVTDELGGREYRKPNPTAYRMLRERMDLPYAEILYVGDNLWRDFVSPGELGMATLYYENDRDVHPEAHTLQGKAPMVTVRTIPEMHAKIRTAVLPLPEEQ